MSNVDIWNNEYAEGKSYLNYPDDAFLKLYYTYKPQQAQLAALDFGAGSGPISEFLLKQNCRVYSCDASPKARGILAQRLRGGQCDIISPEAIATIPDNSLDLIIAWHVLYYLDIDNLQNTMALLKTKMKPGSIFIATMLAEDDIYITKSSPLTSQYRMLNGAGQNGAKILSIEQSDFAVFFHFPKLVIGETRFSIGDRCNHYHLLVGCNI